MKRFFIILNLAIIALPCFAQFIKDNVYLYVKAGQDPVKASEIMVIGYLSSSDEIVNRRTDSDRMKKIIKYHNRYLQSPYNLLEVDATLFPYYWSPLKSQYNTSASTSKYTVYSGHLSGGSNCWGSWSAQTINFAFTKDREQLLFWVTGHEDNRKTYLLTEPSEFDPSTSHSSSYDFLE